MRRRTRRPPWWRTPDSIARHACWIIALAVAPPRFIEPRELRFRSAECLLKRRRRHRGVRPGETGVDEQAVQRCLGSPASTSARSTACDGEAKIAVVEHPALGGQSEADDGAVFRMEAMAEAASPLYQHPEGVGHLARALYFGSSSG